MAAQPLGFTMLDETNSIKQRNNKTIRRKRAPINSSKVKQFLNFMKTNDDDGDEKNESDNVNLGNKRNSLEDSNSLMPKIPNLIPQIPRMPHDKKDNGYPDVKSSVAAFDEDDSDDEGISTENFDMLENGQSNEAYYKQFAAPTANNTNTQYMATYNNMTTAPALASNSDPNNLMKKLNYMIHLLEEQQDEKTENITEELVLYLFLGVFVIFVCDSFSRAGKYKR